MAVVLFGVAESVNAVRHLWRGLRSGAFWQLQNFSLEECERGTVLVKRFGVLLKVEHRECLVAGEDAYQVHKQSHCLDELGLAARLSAELSEEFSLNKGQETNEMGENCKI